MFQFDGTQLFTTFFTLGRLLSSFLSGEFNEKMQNDLPLFLLLCISSISLYLLITVIIYIIYTYFEKQTLHICIDRWLYLYTYLFLLFTQVYVMVDFVLMISLQVVSFLLCGISVRKTHQKTIHIL